MTKKSREEKHGESMSNKIDRVLSIDINCIYTPDNENLYPITLHMEQLSNCTIRFSDNGKTSNDFKIDESQVLSNLKIKTDSASCKFKETVCAGI
jgi:hypothetical protein